MTWLLKLLETMSPQIVAGFKEGMRKLLQDLYEKTLETENDWDDWGVRVMAKVFGVTLTEPEPVE